MSESSICSRTLGKVTCFYSMFVAPLPLLPPLVLLPEDIVKMIWERGKDALSDTKGQPYIFASQTFQTQTMTRDTVTTVTPDQPYTTLSDHIHTFTARSIVCTLVFCLSLFICYHHWSVSTLSILFLHTITWYFSIYNPMVMNPCMQQKGSSTQNGIVTLPDIRLCLHLSWNSLSVCADLFTWVMVESESLCVLTFPRLLSPSATCRHFRHVPNFEHVTRHCSG